MVRVPNYHGISGNVECRLLASLWGDSHGNSFSASPHILFVNFSLPEDLNDPIVIGPVPPTLGRCKYTLQAKDNFYLHPLRGRTLWFCTPVRAPIDIKPSLIIMLADSLLKSTLLPDLGRLCYTVKDVCLMHNTSPMLWQSWKHQEKPTRRRQTTETHWFGTKARHIGSGSAYTTTTENLIYSAC